MEYLNLLPSVLILIMSCINVYLTVKWNKTNDAKIEGYRKEICSLKASIWKLKNESASLNKIKRTRRFQANNKQQNPSYCLRIKDTFAFALANLLTQSTNENSENNKEDFWIKTEQLLYQALIGYIWNELPESEWNFTSLLDLLNIMDVSQKDKNMDVLFNKLQDKDPENLAVHNYRKFKECAGKCTQTVIIRAKERLSKIMM